MSKKFTRRKIVSSLGVSGLGIIGLNWLSKPSLAASTDWTGNNVSQEVSNGTISDVTIPQSNISFEVSYRGLDPSTPLTVRIEARLQTEESTGSDEFDEIGAGSISLDSTDGTVTESDLSLDGYSFPLGIISNHSAIQAPDFAVGDADSKTTTIEIQVTFEQESTTESVTTSFDVTLSERASFTLSNTSYTENSLDVSTEDTAPYGIVFNGDGTKLFMVGLNTETVYSYDLSTAYDTMTASYTGNILDVSTEDASPVGLAFNSDGTKFFMIGQSNDTVYSYDLSTAYDISTASYTDTSFDISTEDTAPFGIVFNGDGTKLFMNGANTETVYSYDLSTAYDISTASYTDTSFDISSEDQYPHGIVFNGEGTKLFIIGNNTANVYSYNLSTAYDISTASYMTSFDVSSESSTPQGIAFNSDGTKFFISGTSNANLYSYSE